MNAATPGDSSPLHCAVDCGHSNIAQLLLEHAAEANAENKDGNTPLMVACDGGNRSVAMLTAVTGVCGDRGCNVHSSSQEKSATFLMFYFIFLEIYIFHRFLGI